MGRIENFEQICIECEELFLKKNTQYGDSISEGGVLGAVVEFIGISARLRQMVIKSGDGGKSADQKSLRDVLMDAHNYANIALMMQQEENFTGAGDGS